VQFFTVFSVPFCYTFVKMGLSCGLGWVCFPVLSVSSSPDTLASVLLSTQPGAQSDHAEAKEKDRIKQ